ncbi:MAG: hydrogenase maturation protease [Candidatus Thermoplasmatota archaeon]|nr:hydrogenase maturation protease [Candidatus Thermoplasmatota archaeon]
MKKAIFGIGNQMMGDDGIGPLLISRLEEIDNFPADVDLVDEGVGGIRIIHDMEGYEKVLIIDAADFGGAPGEYRLFRPEEAETVKQLSGRSLHEMDLMRAIELARITDGAPKDILIMAIQPESVEMRMGVSEILLSMIEDYVDAVRTSIM